MKVVRIVVLIPSVILLAVVTGISLFYLCIEMTLLNPTFSIEAYGTMGISDLIVEEAYGDGLETLIQSSIDEYDQQSTEDSAMPDIDVAQIAQLLRTHLPREEVTSLLDDIVLGVYTYVMTDEGDLPILDIEFVIDGISRVVPELVDTYLSDYYLPDTKQIADYLEKGHEVGIINRYTVDWILGKVMSSEIDMENVDEKRVKDFLAANERNFKEGNFNAAELTSTYTEALIMEQLDLSSFEGTIALETLIDDRFGGMASLRQLKDLRKKAVSVARQLFPIVMIGLLLVILLLTGKGNTFLKVVSITWLVVGGIQMVMILFNMFTSFIQDTIPVLFGTQPLANDLSEQQLLGLQTGIQMVNQVYMLVFGVLVLVAVMLLVSAIIIKRMTGAKVKEKVKNSSNMYLEAIRLLGIIVIYIGLYKYIGYIIDLLKGLQI